MSGSARAVRSARAQAYSLASLGGALPRVVPHAPGTLYYSRGLGHDELRTITGRTRVTWRILPEHYGREPGEHTCCFFDSFAVVPWTEMSTCGRLSFQPVVIMSSRSLSEDA